MKKKKRKTPSKSKKIRDLHLDKPTSHYPGGWIDRTPVNIQIANYLDDMGLLEDVEHGVLSEQDLRSVIKKLLLEIHNYNS